MRLVRTHYVDDLGPVFSFGLPSVQDEKNDILHHGILWPTAKLSVLSRRIDFGLLLASVPIHIDSIPRRFTTITTPTSKSLERRQTNCWIPMRWVWKREAGRVVAGLGLDSEVTLVIWLNRRSLQHQPRVFPGPIPGHGGVLSFPCRPRRDSRLSCRGCPCHSCFDGDAALMASMYGYRHRSRRCNIERPKSETLRSGAEKRRAVSGQTICPPISFVSFFSVWRAATRAIARPVIRRLAVGEFLVGS